MTDTIEIDEGEVRKVKRALNNATSALYEGRPVAAHEDVKWAAEIVLGWTNTLDEHTDDGGT